MSRPLDQCCEVCHATNAEIVRVADETRLLCPQCRREWLAWREASQSLSSSVSRSILHWVDRWSRRPEYQMGYHELRATIKGLSMDELAEHALHTRGIAPLRANPLIASKPKKGAYMTATETLTAELSAAQAVQATPETAVIPFHGSALRVREVDGQVWVAVKPICEHLGIAWQPQLAKLSSDAKFSCNDIVITAADGKNYSTTCLPQDQLLGWLYTINANKIKVESRPLLLAYQKETTRAISDYWTKGAAVRPSAAAPVQEADSMLAMFEMSLNAMKEQRAQLGQLALKTDAIEQKLNTLPINGHQKRQVHKAVRQLALLLGGKPHHYQKAWRELYDRFEIVAYGDLPASRFEEAMQFLSKLLEAYQTGDNLGLSS